MYKKTVENLISFQKIPKILKSRKKLVRYEQKITLESFLNTGDDSQKSKNALISYKYLFF
jgi:hypothetical protein